MKRALAALFGMFLLASADALAAEPGRKIDFEGDVVEGMNRQPLDSITQISEGDGSKDKPHLYRKRTDFREETKETVRELLETN